jgi:hypothetical protein
VLNNFVIENSIKSKLTFRGAWGGLLVLLKSPQLIWFYEGDSIIFEPKVNDIEFWLVLVNENSIKVQKLDLEQEISNPSHTSFNNLGKTFMGSTYCTQKCENLIHYLCLLSPMDKVR